MDVLAVPPGLVSIRFTDVEVDLSGRMKLFGRVLVRLWLVLLVRLVACLLWGVLDFGVLLRSSVMTDEGDGLLISIGRVIRLVLGEPVGFFSVVEDFGLVGEPEGFLSVVEDFGVVGEPTGFLNVVEDFGVVGEDFGFLLVMI